MAVFGFSKIPENQHTFFKKALFIEHPH